MAKDTLEFTDIDEPLNTNPTYTATHVFSTDDVTGKFDGTTQGDITPGETPIIDFAATPIYTNDGIALYPINSEFGFIVSDFDGAVEKDFDLNPEYEEGFAGDLLGTGGEQLGLVLSDAPTDSFKTPATLGTWLAGIGGNTVKASTEHYVVMQNVLSDQEYPGDPDALYPLDDELYVIGGEFDGQSVADVIAIVGDVNGDGAADIRDVLEPNENSISEAIAASTDYSVTLKDDGKLLYRWGNTVKRPNDIRVEAEIPLPDEWTPEVDAATGLMPLFIVTSAELVIRHTITNNPNDQVRPEDYENESAIGTLPTYEILPDGKWVTTDDYYAGDGTLYPAGTVLKDPALAELAEGSALDQIGALSEDLEEGFTNAWYTTMDREPFEAVVTDGEYDVGPRWRLKPNKYGQDLPSVEIPLDPSLEPPATQSQIKYEVGLDTQTVLNLLDWEGASPLAISAGWQSDPGTVTENGLNLTPNFDVAFYVKGDQKPATLYDAELVLSYEEATILAEGAAIVGTTEDDVLVGQGGNTFTGDAGEDMFVLSYGKQSGAEVINSTITDFEIGEDAVALIGFGVTDESFASSVSQTVVGGDLQIALDGFDIALLQGVGEALDVEDFRLFNPGVTGSDPDDFIGPDAIIGTDDSDRLVGTDGDDQIVSLAGAYDVMVGGEGSDQFIFTGETTNGIREKDKISDYEVGLDAIIFIEEVEIQNIVQRSRGVSIYLEEDRDAIYVLGEGLTVDNITIINGIEDAIA